MIRSFIVICLIVFFCGYLLVIGCERHEKYTGAPEIRKLWWAMDEYASNYGKAKNMELLKLGNFTEGRRRINFGVWLRAYDPVSLEEGRILAAEFVQDYWNTFREHPFTEQCLEKVWKHGREHEVGLQNFAVKIAYWDLQVNRPPIPYVAEITFYDKTFNYYQADPKTQALRLIYQESYDEAMDNLKRNTHI